jgi:hypothetical protein
VRFRIRVGHGCYLLFHGRAISSLCILPFFSNA